MQRILFITLLFIISITQLKAQDDSLVKWKTNLQTEKDARSRGELLYKIGYRYTYKVTNADSALHYYKKSIEITKTTDDTRGLGAGYYAIGIYHIRGNNQKEAIKYLTMAENTFAKGKDTMAFLHASFARADLLKPEQKIKRFKELIAIAEVGTFPSAKSSEISLRGGLGGAYKDLGKYDQAIIEHKKQYKLNKEFKSNRYDHKRKTLEHEAEACLKLGDLYIIKKNYKEAYKFLEEAYNNCNAISKDFHLMPKVASSMVQLFGEWKKNKPNEFNQSSAKKYNTLRLLKDADRVSKKSKSYYSAMNVIKGFLDYYKKRGNRDSIIHFQNKLITMKDSFYRDEQIQASAKFSEELKTADKEKEIIQLNVDKKIASATANRNKIIFFLILIGLLSSIYFIIKRIKYRNQKEQEERDKNFRSKLSSDLHDDVGTILTSLSMQSELLEMKTTDGNKSTVGKIAGMSRDATRRMRDTVWAIDSRKDNIMDLAYRMIDFAEDMLYAKDVEFQLTHNIESKDQKISAELRQNIFLIFKEAITNAAKYGTGAFVTASLQKGKDELILQIQNETKQAINLTEVSGLGLSNMKKRVADLNGTFSIENQANAFNVKLYFPL